MFRQKLFPCFIFSILPLTYFVRNCFNNYCLILFQQIAFKNLVQRNKQVEKEQGSPAQNTAIHLPFIIVNTSKKTVIDCSISNDKWVWPKIPCFTPQYTLSWIQCKFGLNNTITAVFQNVLTDLNIYSTLTTHLRSMMTLRCSKEWVWHLAWRKDSVQRPTWRLQEQWFPKLLNHMLWVSKNKSLFEAFHYPKWVLENDSEILTLQIILLRYGKVGTSWTSRNPWQS